MNVNTIILVETYLPGAASSNRMICYAKGYQSMGINTIFLLQCPTSVELPVIDGVTIERVPESSSNLRIVRIAKRVTSMLQAIRRYYIKGETVVHVWNVPLFVWFINKKKYNIVCELGEIPNYAEGGSFLYRIKENLRKNGPLSVKGIIVQTNALAEYFHGMGVKNIVQSNIFVDTTRFEGIRKTPAKRIAYCGTISKHKDGVDDLIKAFKIVHDKYDDYKLMIIGGYTSAYQDKEELESLVKQLSLEDSVVFTGKVLPSEMPQLLYDSSVLALARPDNIQAKYGFPTKVGEYLCTGNPTVVTKVGELPLFLADKKNCVFATPDDFEDFAEKVLWVIEHPDLAQQIAENGRELVHSVFSIDGQCRKVLSFFRAVD